VSPDSNPVARVAEFYDAHVDAFARVYGDVIQALRTTDVTRLLDIEAATMDLKPGEQALDAGCGVCGPAMHFAGRYGVRIDAVTASPVQQRLAADKIAAAGLDGRIRVRQGDFHDLTSVFPGASYDVVFFLESFGHSHDKRRALQSAFDVLRPGGRLYIKDLFAKEPVLELHRAPIRENIRRINEAYCYDVGDLYDVLRHIRTMGLILAAVKTVDIPLEEFENLTISNEFQTLTGIHRIDDLSTYVFPVEFYELLCVRPAHALDVGHTRYFLQNLYNLQVLGVPAREL
jgi:ubiquinone/menaquinone biosynthesis C-methylase UbiE